MRRPSSLALVGALPLAAFAAGCGGNQTTASKSAAAFDEAQRKGVPPTAGEAHGQHGDAARATDHSAHGGSAIPGMDHANMPGRTGPRGAHTGSTAAPRPSQTRAPHAHTPVAGKNHSNMPGLATAHGVHPGSTAAGTPGHTRAPRVSAPKTGMDHANMPGTDHSAMAQPRASTAPPVPERPAAVASREQLVATLRPDGLDVPEPTAIREAARAAEIAQQMDGGGHGMSHGTYRQLDAGRDDVAPTPSGHEGHQMAPAAPSPSSAAPHGTRPARPAPAPSADPHAGHAMPAAPRPSPPPMPRPTPTPRPKEDNR